MNSKHKLFAFLCLLFFVTGITKAQIYNENDPKWDQTPSTVFYPLGNYVPLPQKVLPVPRSMVPRVMKTPNEVLIIYPNIQVLPSPGVLQIETPIVASRVNPLFMFGSANIIQSGQINAGSYWTTNGGTSWSGLNYINNGNSTNQRSDPGPAIDKNQRIIFTHITSSSNFGAITGMGAEWSTNFGANFSATVQIENNTNVDKNLAASDDNPGSPYYGNTYVAYTVFAGSNANGHFNRTTDGGLTWGSAYQINTTPSPYFAQGHDVDVRPNGDVIVCWTLGQQSSPYTEHYVGVGKSTDGGVSFNSANVQEEAYAVNGTRSFAFNGWSSFRINGFPRISIDKSGGPRNGWIYIVDDQVSLAPAGNDADVILHRSTDGGATWSAGIRVNQDPLNDGKVQFFPCVNVDANGGVNVAYYDNRNFPSVGDSCSVFISRSLDGGNTWVDAEVADHHYIPKQPPGVGGGFDYMGVTSANGKVWAFWSDDKSGTFNAWAGYITSGPQPQHDIACGPFLSLPAIFLINNTYAIKTKVTNIGAANETGVPVKFFINGSLMNTTNLNLNSGQSDSVSNNWMPTVAGPYTLTYCSALSNDTNRTNDTVRVTVNVLSSLPALCEGFNSTTFPPTNWTLSGGSNWSRSAVSGYGLGTGSARYYGWLGTDIEDLKTMTFNPVTNNAIQLDIAYAPYPATQPYAQDSLNIFASTDGGTTWTAVIRMGPLQMQTAPASNSEFTPTASQWQTRTYTLPTGTNKIDFQAHGAAGNDYFIDSTCTVNLTGISNNHNVIPVVYSLSQNFPNPFNPTTLIKYGIPKQGLVKIVVYDILGREVSTLINELKQAGTYEINFNASDLASGVYFYRITAGDFTDVKKMMLIK